MGRPGGQDVIAEELYFGATGGSRGAAFTDAATYDAQYRPLALAPTLALEQAATAANPNLRYFNWKAEYGHTMVHLLPDRGVIECWQTPQRVRSDDARLLAQFRTMIGRPHLQRIPAPSPATGPDRGRLAPEITRHEPGLALYAGADGLSLIRRLAPEAAAAVARMLAFEVGFGQAGAVAEIVREAGFADTHAVADLAGIERVVVGKR